jgi:sugar-specific transcriptional regulator TrmB
MEDTLIKVGLPPKEARIYMLLLEGGPQNAAELADKAGEKRTNMYMLLDAMVEKGVIRIDSHKPVKVFSAADPSALTRMLQIQQERQQQAAAALKTALPQLRIQYALVADKPGVTHAVGEEGYKILLDDMVRSTTEVLVVASDDIPPNSTVLDELRKRLYKRKEAGVQTRAIFHNDDKRAKHKAEFSERGIELRFLGERPFRGEVVVYEDNVAFTVYEPSLIVTVITNKAIAETMRIMFEELWTRAEE